MKIDLNGNTKLVCVAVIFACSFLITTFVFAANEPTLGKPKEVKKTKIAKSTLPIGSSAALEARSQALLKEERELINKIKTEAAAAKSRVAKTAPSKDAEPTIEKAEAESPKVTRVTAETQPEKAPAADSTSEQSQSMASLNVERAAEETRGQEQEDEAEQPQVKVADQSEMEDSATLALKIKAHAEMINDLQGKNAELQAQFAMLQEKIDHSQAEFQSEKARLVAAIDRGEHVDTTAAAAKLKSLERDYNKIKDVLQQHTSLLQQIQDGNDELRNSVLSTERDVKNILRDTNVKVASLNKFLANDASSSVQLSDVDAGVARIVTERPSPQPRSVPMRSLPQDVTYTLVPHNEVTTDMPVVTVVQDNTELWTGPGEEDSVVAKSPRGSRLAVESTLGDWYRIIAPDGSRAWVQSRFVTFGQEDGQTLNISGADPTLEERAPAQPE